MRLLYRLIQAALGPPQLLHRGKDLQPGPLSRFIAGRVQRVGAHRRVQLRTGPMLVKQQLRAPIGVKLIHAALACGSE